MRTVSGWTVPHSNSCEVVVLVVVVVFAAEGKTTFAVSALLTYSDLVVEPKWRAA